jgi:uncharacterized protein YciW
MAFSPQFKSQYIREFAGIVRMGTSSTVYSEWTQRIREALLEIPDPKIKREAQERITRISNYVSILIEDPEGSRAHIAEELEELADFVSKIGGIERSL